MTRPALTRCLGQRVPPGARPEASSLRPPARALGVKASIFPGGFSMDGALERATEGATEGAMEVAAPDQRTDKAIP
jgi:hypothetical protein